ncbi:MAG: MFS transporter [Chloroflexi bacterium]|nr:MFS transporter [Chloroflexota bacterium]
MTAMGILAIPAPYIGGLLYDNVAPEATFIVASVFVLLAIPLTLRKLHVPSAETTDFSIPARMEADILEEQKV